MKSKLTDTFQTTIPPAIRKKLHLKRNDNIEWVFDKDHAVVWAIHPDTLKGEGALHGHAAQSLHRMNMSCDEIMLEGLHTIQERLSRF
jgi:bifunctional DNA-binding transcriptional regulator/antitoxin component of YhaV-PrlF toxin-antitoxin module